jgi:hypothetical protein
MSGTEPGSVPAAKNDMMPTKAASRLFVGPLQSKALGRTDHGEAAVLQFGVLLFEELFGAHLVREA